MGTITLVAFGLRENILRVVDSTSLQSTNVHNRQEACYPMNIFCSSTTMKPPWQQPPR